ncbi:hypothetical protein B296_00045566, partial [Ensete ventricosum]
FDSLFQGRERVAPSDVQGAVPATPTSTSQCQNNRRVLGHAEVPAHLHQKSEPLRSENVTDTESTDRKENINGSEDEGASKTCSSESSLKLQSAEMTVGSSSLSEDEEYTYENPRVDMQCTHQYHLGCIYEWMERSQNCPFCSKVISFSKW